MGVRLGRSRVEMTVVILIIVEVLGTTVAIVLVETRGG